MNDTQEKLVWIDGQILPADQAAVSVFDHGLLYGDGIFEGIRIYNNRIFKLASHLRRLYEGAQSIDLKIQFDQDRLADALRQTVKANNRENGYIRLVVTRGAGTLGLDPYRCPKSTTFIIVDAIKLYTPEDYENGLPIITAKTMRNHPRALNSRVKSLNYLNNIMGKVEAIKAGVTEALMLNHEGNVSECTTENIFMVRDNQIFTPPLSANILAGITRQTVIELAVQSDLPVHEQDFTRDQLITADEAFLTGTAAEVLGISKVDEHIIGSGKRGPITGQLMQAFTQLVAENAPED